MTKNLKVGKNVTERKDKVKAKSNEGFWEFMGQVQTKKVEDVEKKPKEEKELKATATPGELPPEPKETATQELMEDIEKERLSKRKQK